MMRLNLSPAEGAERLGVGELGPEARVARGARRGAERGEEIGGENPRAQLWRESTLNRADDARNLRPKGCAYPRGYRTGNAEIARAHHQTHTHISP